MLTISPYCVQEYDFETEFPPIQGRLASTLCLSSRFVVLTSNMIYEQTMMVHINIVFKIVFPDGLICYLVICILLEIGTDLNKIFVHT